MLSSVLNSDKAVDVNVQIIRIFIKMRELLLSNKDILLQLNQMQTLINGHEDRTDAIYNYLKQFIQDQNKPRMEAGYRK